MVPEILHRCPSCGASVRDFERAMFCPECGKTLTETKSEKPNQEMPEVVNESADHSAADEPLIVQPAGVATVDATKEAGSSESDPPKNLGTEDRHTARERTRETLHRASNRARGAIEDNVKRVEKIHHVSTVMLEEATYDPSLRFVLVALGLFAVFIILLVLSKVMG